MPTDSPMPTETPVLAAPAALIDKALGRALADNALLDKIRGYIQSESDIREVVERASHEAAKEVLNGVRDFILGDPEFRSVLGQALERSASAVAKGAVLHPAKEELQKVVKDYMFFQTAHGSEYATRRLKELRATLETL
jgi:hypothetical protein